MVGPTSKLFVVECAEFSGRATVGRRAMDSGISVGGGGSVFVGEMLFGPATVRSEWSQ